MEVYRVLLESEGLKKFHLIPLNWEKSETWIGKAKMALDWGYLPRDIARASYGFPISGVSWVGNESDMRREWVERFDGLCSHEDERIREVGLIGKEEAKIKMEEALRRERAEEVFGFKRSRTLGRMR